MIWLINNCLCSCDDITGCHTVQRAFPIHQQQSFTDLSTSVFETHRSIERTFLGKSLLTTVLFMCFSPSPPISTDLYTSVLKTHTSIERTFLWKTTSDHSAIHVLFPFTNNLHRFIYFCVQDPQKGFEDIFRKNSSQHSASHVLSTSTNNLYRYVYFCIEDMYTSVLKICILLY